MSPKGESNVKQNKLYLYAKISYANSFVQNVQEINHNVQRACVNKTERPLFIIDLSNKRNKAC